MFLNDSEIISLVGQLEFPILNTPTQQGFSCVAVSCNN